MHTDEFRDLLKGSSDLPLSITKSSSGIFDSSARLRALFKSGGTGNSSNRSSSTASELASSDAPLLGEICRLLYANTEWD